MKNWNQTNNAWKPFLDSQTTQPYYQDLQAYLASRKEAGAIIYPPEDEIFKAFDLTPLDKIKVVILGQDPYPNEGMGFPFFTEKHKP